MPRDAEGNITTTPSVEVKTIFDVMHEEKVDVVPLFKGGMARIAEDKADGNGVTIATANVTETP